MLDHSWLWFSTVYKGLCWTCSVSLFCSRVCCFLHGAAGCCCLARWAVCLRRWSGSRAKRKPEPLLLRAWATSHVLAAFTALSTAVCWPGTVSVEGRREELPLIERETSKLEVHSDRWSLTLASPWGLEVICGSDSEWCECLLTWQGRYHDHRVVWMQISSSSQEQFWWEERG